jgi:glycosyltransferase involved in cell wall biosynthesis
MRAQDPIERPRVLHVLAGAGVGGTERQLLLLLPALASEVDTSLLIIRDGPLRDRFAAEVPTRTLPKHGKIDPLFLIRLVREIRRSAPDIVQTWGTTANVWGSLAARLARVPRLIVTEGALDEWKGRLHRKIDRVVYRWADALVCNSAQVADFLRGHGAAPERTHVITNAVAAFELAEPVEADVIGYLGRLHPVKGADVLIESLPAVIAARPGVRCIVAGPAAAPIEQDFAERLRSRAGKLGLEANVQLCGALDDPAVLFRQIAVLVVPSRSEGSPNVVVEAMAAGVPVVATAVGGVPEIVTDGVNGTLVRPEDPAALAHAILDCLADRSSARVRAARARDGVLAQHALAAVTGAWVSLYAGLGTRVQAAA